MRTRSQPTGEFTGRHMLLIMLAFFGVIIGVNVVMATLASTSWTGFVVENSYVASQEFNTRAEQGRAQAALGWTSSLTIAGGEIRYRLTDAAGKSVSLDGVAVQLRRPAYAAEDRSLMLTPSNDGEFATLATLGDGLWIIEVDADARLERPYREVRRIVIAHGVLQ
jgi:nitrogen fixation protein FixH